MKITLLATGNPLFKHSWFKKERFLTRKTTVEQADNMLNGFCHLYFIMLIEDDGEEVSDQVKNLVYDIQSRYVPTFNQAIVRLHDMVTSLMRAYRMEQ